MLWSIGSIYFLGNHCKYFIQFHIVLCSTEHWRFDVNSVNVLTSMAAAFFPLQRAVLSEGSVSAGPVWHGGSAHLGGVAGPHPRRQGAARLCLSRQQSWALRASRSHLLAGGVCRQRGWSVPRAGCAHCAHVYSSALLTRWEIAKLPNPFVLTFAGK